MIGKRNELSLSCIKIQNFDPTCFLFFFFSLMEEKSEVNTPTDSLHPRNNNDNSSSSTANGYTIGQQGTYGETDVNQVDIEGIIYYLFLYI